MAADCHLNRSKNLALYLLAVWFARHYGFLLFEHDMRAVVSKILGGLAVLAILPLLYQPGPVAWVLAWLAFESSLVVLCPVAWMIWPWVVPEGWSMCSALIGFDVGAIGVVIAAVLLLKITRKS